jgi:hypothetical protein
MLGASPYLTRALHIVSPHELTHPKSGPYGVLHTFFHVAALRGTGELFRLESASQDFFASLSHFFMKTRHRRAG